MEPSPTDDLDAAIQADGPMPAAVTDLARFTRTMAALDLATLPAGFLAPRFDGDEVELRYQSTGLRHVAVPRTLQLCVWIFLCLVFTIGMGREPEWVVVAIVAGVWIVAGKWTWWILWQYCSTASFRFRRDVLIIDRHLFGFRRRTNVPRRAVTAVEQIHSQGQKVDHRSASPTWDLDVFLGGFTVNALHEQPIEKSDWLGPLVALWAQVEFHPASRE